MPSKGKLKLMDSTPAPTPVINAPAPSGKGFIIERMGAAQVWDAERGMLQNYWCVPPTVFADREQAETRVVQTIARWDEQDRERHALIFTITPVGKRGRS